ncbi:LysR family transcriptional regulator [Paratractidigestivibacter sp.]|uniref:LysR family transcriptional regulator n=1 Tax=Paratractidigestivibacter sp. TaxID=2847316 RepID=UPI002ABE04D2|nr:LysR family transcriptional regulator [Paratractidigestivibacter sp.]
MDTQRCREFVVLAQTCNYLQAADQLFISQSSLSKHIKSLERELGVELFKRTTRRVQLSDQGRIFLPFARKLASVAHDAEVALADAADNSRRIIDIGSIPVMVPYGITALLHSFERNHPNMRLRITEGEADQLKGMLRNRRLDLAFIREWDGDVRLDGGDEEFATSAFAADRLAAVLPSGHSLAARSSISLSELANEEFLLLPQGTVMNELIMDACAVEGFVPEVRYRGTRAENIIDLVARGMGVSLLMRTPAAYLTRAAVSIVDLENPIVTQIKVYRLRDRDPSPETLEFLEHISLADRRQG